MMKFTSTRDGSEIEAFKWTGGHDQTEPFWMAATLRDRDAVVSGEFAPAATMTFRSGQIAKPGDWVIRDAAGNIFPCRREYFWGRYKPLH